jgi:hypothetical protein
METCFPRDTIPVERVSIGISAANGILFPKGRYAYGTPFHRYIARMEKRFPRDTIPVERVSIGITIQVP